MAEHSRPRFNSPPPLPMDRRSSRVVFILVRGTRIHRRSTRRGRFRFASKSPMIESDLSSDMPRFIRVYRYTCYILYTHIYIYKSKRGGAGWLKRITEESGFDVWLDLRWTRTRTDSTRNSKSLWTPASSPLLFDRNFRDGGGRRPFVTRRPIVRRRCVFSNFKDVRFVIRETNFPVSRHPRNRRRSYENSLHPKKKGEREISRRSRRGTSSRFTNFLTRAAPRYPRNRSKCLVDA